MLLRKTKTTQNQPNKNQQNPKPNQKPHKKTNNFFEWNAIPMR